MLIRVLGGFLMALADSVPGVSGGTIAFLMGIYDEFIGSLNNIVSKDKEKRKAAVLFLVKLGSGWIIGMAMASIIINQIFEKHIYNISSLFIGFVLFAMPIIIMEEKDLNYFRVKTECTVELSDGALAKKKIEELILATSYTEAEMLVNEIISSLNRTQFGSVNYEIIKTKISDVLFNDTLVQEQTVKGFYCNYFEEDENTGVGLYMVKVMFLTLDERTGKEKKTIEDFYVPALSNADANDKINTHLKKTMSDFVIRDTKFDKAEAIYWPLDVHKRKVENFELS